MTAAIEIKGLTKRFGPWQRSRIGYLCRLRFSVAVAVPAA
jgi:hypothetical protein